MKVAKFKLSSQDAFDSLTDKADMAEYKLTDAMRKSHDKISK